MGVGYTVEKSRVRWERRVLAENMIAGSAGPGRYPFWKINKKKAENGLNCKLRPKPPASIHQKGAEGRFYGQPGHLYQWCIDAA